LITVEDVKNFLGIDTPKDFQEQQLTAIVDGVNASVSNYCDRKLFSSGPITEWLNGNGRAIMQLKEYPLVSVTSVTYYDELETATAVIAGDYWANSDSGQLELRSAAAHGSRWIRGRHNYKVAYTAGYAAAAIPDDLKLACLTWAAVLFQRAEHKLHAIRSITLGDQNTSYRFDKIPPEVEAMLQGYVRLPYA